MPRCVRGGSIWALFAYSVRAGVTQRSRPTTYLFREPCKISLVKGRRAREIAIRFAARRVPKSMRSKVRARARAIVDRKEGDAVRYRLPIVISFALDTPCRIFNAIKSAVHGWPGALCSCSRLGSSRLAPFGHIPNINNSKRVVRPSPKLRASPVCIFARARACT